MGLNPGERNVGDSGKRRKDAAIERWIGVGEAHRLVREPEEFGHSDREFPLLEGMCVLGCGVDPFQPALNRAASFLATRDVTSDEEHVTIFTGQAEIIDHADLPDGILDRYAARYTEGMTGIKMTRAEYEAAYSIPIRVTPEKLRGW